VLEEIEALGATLAAVSPEAPESAVITVEKNHLTFDVLNDAGNTVAGKFGLVFELPEDLREFYLTLGIDLRAHNRDEGRELPLPATFVIDRDGTIRAAFADADYVRRMEPTRILSTLQQILRDLPLPRKADG
jgi:peroxiredoxin